MKRIIIVLMLSTLVLAAASAQQSVSSQAAAEISFNYVRQTGSASNQFAVWVEDNNGNPVKTLFVTRWTANGGFRRRPSTIPVWVKQSGVADLPKAQVDAMSGATPRAGTLTYTWDGTDSAGKAVSPGNYFIILEGTLRWENQVLYRAPITLGQRAAPVEIRGQYTGDLTDERSMISNVRVQVLR